MAEKNGFDDEQTEFWHPDGSGRKVTKEVFLKETAARQAEVPLTIPTSGLGLGRVDMLPEHGLPGPRPDLRYLQAIQRQREPQGRWLSLPLVGLGERLNTLTGHPEPVPFFYEGTIEAAQIVGVCQVPADPFIGEHARSDIYLRFGGKIFCTLTPQQVLRRLGIAVEEVAS